jgi:hypothetical protein
MKSIPYREAIGSIMYLAINTQPDLSYTIHILSRFMSDPGIDHWQALKHLLQYIKGTVHYSIIYHCKGTDGSTLQPSIYADTLYANCPDTAKLLHGYVAMMANGPVSWSS